MTGYQTYSSIPQNNMGIITLSPDFKVLGEVTVLSQKPTIKLSNEGMVTTVTGSILANVGTADDVICRLPLVNGKMGPIQYSEQEHRQYTSMVVKYVMFQNCNSFPLII